MNPIILPILITITIVGIISILSKIFYNYRKDRSSDGLQSNVSKHLEESFDKSHIANNEFGFVTKSWEEPMKKQYIISNEYQKEDNFTSIDSDINNNDNSANVSFDGLNDDKNDFGNENGINYEIDNYIVDEFTNQKNSNDTHIDDNIYIDKFQNEKYSEIGSYDSDLNKLNIDENIVFEDENEGLKIRNIDYSRSKFHQNCDENNPLSNIGSMDIGEQVIIEGKPQIIKVGDEIIFNYNRESYSSRILEIKHKNIRVKYRAQEKWISFSDIKKIF